MESVVSMIVQDEAEVEGCKSKRRESQDEGEGAVEGGGS